MSAHEDAQRWHDTQAEIDPAHREEYSSCWCCCTFCDPVWERGPGNPYWAAAQPPASPTES